MQRCHTLDLIAPALYRSALSELGIRTSASACEAEALFGREDQESLRIATFLMMATLPGVVDYVRAAPVIVLASTLGAGLRDGRRQELFVTRARQNLRAGNRLRDLLHNLRVAYPLRGLAASTISDGHFNWTAVRQLSRSVPPPMLGQAVPRIPCRQFDWLRAFATFNRATADKIGQRDRQCRWAAAAFGQVLSRGECLPEPDDIVLAAKYLFAHPEFNERWSIERVLAQAAEWQRAREARRLRRLLGDKLAPPDIIEVDRLTLVALHTKAALLDEGRAMRHCVGSYFPSMELSFFYSVREHGRRVATLQIERSGDVFKIVQLQGPGNSPVDGWIVAGIREALSWLTPD